MRGQSGIGTYAEKKLGDKLWVLRKFFIFQCTDFCETEVVLLILEFKVYVQIRILIQ